MNTKRWASCQNALSIREHVDVAFELFAALRRYFTHVYSRFKIGLCGNLLSLKSAEL